MKNYKVYLIRDKYKKIIYCGLTGGSLQTRLYDHITRRKGIDKTCTIELVQEYLTLEQAALLERMLISQYDLINLGLNKSPGSINGSSQQHSEKQKKKWSEERKGCPVSPEHADKNRVARLGKKNTEEHNQILLRSLQKSIMCLETGKIYESARKAAKDLGLQYSKISLVCHGKRETTGGLHFKFIKK